MAIHAPAIKKSTKGRKSAAIALAIVGVAGLSLASAAQLTINSSSLGAGTSVVASCDPTGITVGFGTGLNTTSHTYDTNSLALTTVNVACNNPKYKGTVATVAAPCTEVGHEL